MPWRWNRVKIGGRDRESGEKKEGKKSGVEACEGEVGSAPGRSWVDGGFSRIDGMVAASARHMASSRGAGPRTSNYQLLWPPATVSHHFCEADRANGTDAWAREIGAPVVAGRAGTSRRRQTHRNVTPTERKPSRRTLWCLRGKKGEKKEGQFASRNAIAGLGGTRRVHDCVVRMQ